MWFSITKLVGSKLSKIIYAIVSGSRFLKKRVIIIFV